MLEELDKLYGKIPPESLEEASLSHRISERISVLMQEHGLTRSQFAAKLGRRPSEVTKWLSGEHNFTLRTIAMLTVFFGQSIITIPTSENRDR